MTIFSLRRVVHTPRLTLRLSLDVYPTSDPQVSLFAHRKESAWVEKQVLYARQTFDEEYLLNKAKP